MKNTFRSGIYFSVVFAMLSFHELAFSFKFLDTSITTPTKNVTVTPKAKPYNILIFIADDLGVDMIPQYEAGGSDLPILPTITQLIENGVIFKNTWSNPVCSPTRATIQTGRYGFRTGIGTVIHTNPNGGEPYGLPLEEITLPEMLNLGTKGLYKHALIGKWHLNNSITGPNDHGWDYFAGTRSNFNGQFDYFHWPKIVNGQQTTSNTYAPVENLNDALNWIAQTQEPWLLYFAFNLPHSPLHNPPDDLHTTPFPGQGNVIFDFQHRLAFKCMTEAMDTIIRRLLNGIDSDILANTLVIFVGDNGTTSHSIENPAFDPDHAKGTLYQQSIHVPLIVSGPLVRKPGSQTDALVNTSDIFATVAEIAEVDLNKTLPGIKLDSMSILPYLANADRPSVRKTIFSEKFTVNNSPDDFPNVTERLWQCQEDIGYKGPGDLNLNICGAPLAYGNTNDLRLSGGQPFTNGIIFLSDTLNPMIWNGGIIISDEATQTTVTTDANGEIFIPDFAINDLPPENGIGNTKKYVQVALEDATQQGRYVISNGISVEYLMFNIKAIRGLKYKLITNLYGGEEFYNLKEDPLERINLLNLGVSHLNEEERNAYDALKIELNTLQQSQ